MDPLNPVSQSQVRGPCRLSHEPNAGPSVVSAPALSHGAPSSTTKAFVVTGKLLLMATMIAGLAAVCIFCPPVAGVFAITFVAGWIGTGAAISTFLGLSSLACELKENEWPGNLGNMFRYTDHNGKDCAIFLLSSIGLPFIPFCCCLWTAAACRK